MAQSPPAKPSLRRSFSEHVKDSTNKAWDVFWRNMRERRLWGESGTLRLVGVLELGVGEKLQHHTSRRKKGLTSPESDTGARAQSPHALASVERSQTCSFVLQSDFSARGIRACTAGRGLEGKRWKSVITRLNLTLPKY
ncbi:hypothetical protein Q8A73_022764 [Channa argus]|nr:hypothetical protein Q8A73_022764 [Channa argus]